MNAFDLFKIPLTFSLDLDHLEKTYITLSHHHHPDRVINGSTREKLDATVATANLNEAYAKLCSPLKRGYHLLKLLDPTSTADQEHTIKDSALLMETMENHEALENASTSEAIQTLLAETQEKQRDSLKDIQKFFQTKALEQIPLALYRYRYYDKFLKDAQTKLDQHAFTT